MEAGEEPVADVLLTMNYEGTILNWVQVLPHVQHGHVFVEGLPKEPHRLSQGSLSARRH